MLNNQQSSGGISVGKDSGEWTMGPKLMPSGYHDQKSGQL